MKEGLKKPLRAFALFAAVEAVLYLLAATVAWAVVWRSSAGLDQAYFATVGAKLASQIVGGVLGLCVAINLVAALVILRRGEKPVAIVISLMTAGLASLYFLPVRFSVYGLGGILGLLIAYKLLRVFWSALTWLPKKIFRRTPKDAKPVPQATAAVKPKAKPPKGS